MRHYKMMKVRIGFCILYYTIMYNHSPTHIILNQSTKSLIVSVIYIDISVRIILQVIFCRIMKEEFVDT